jgi:hypothetical protein
MLLRAAALGRTIDGSRLSQRLWMRPCRIDGTRPARRTRRLAAIYPRSASDADGGDAKGAVATRARKRNSRSLRIRRAATSRVEGARGGL